ncbi:MAG: hypothetical protein ACOCP8_03280 [archaeon]
MITTFVSDIINKIEAAEKRYNILKNDKDDMVKILKNISFIIRSVKLTNHQTIKLIIIAVITVHNLCKVLNELESIYGFHELLNTKYKDLNKDLKKEDIKINYILNIQNQKYYHGISREDLFYDLPKEINVLSATIEIE